MTSIELPGLADRVRSLPSDAAGRNRELQRLVDLYAATEAAAALHEAARERGAAILRAADVVTAAALTGSPLPAGARQTLRAVVTAPEFVALVPSWIRELREIASRRPDSGACTVATALELWSWTIDYYMSGDGSRIDAAAQVIDELAEIGCALVAARCFAIEASTDTSEAALRSDLADVYASRTAAAVSASCAELVFGYRRHLRWDAEGCAACYADEELYELEGFMPGMASSAGNIDVIGADGSHALKAGPCARFDGVDGFVRLRNKLDGCLTGARIAKDRAAAAIALSMSANTEGRS